jgi:hypothetical protein
MAENQEAPPPANPRQGRPRGTGGGKLVRSETVTVRLDPKLRYLAELAARMQRRTLSSFIEWAIEDALKRVALHRGTGFNGDDDVTVEQEANRLWDVDGAERFARLAVRYPELLTYEDQQVWKLLNDSLLLEPARRRTPEGTLSWDWPTLEDRVFPRLRDHWPNLMMAALGPPSEQRRWVERRREEFVSGKIYPDLVAKKDASSSGVDDEIPF